MKMTPTKPKNQLKPIVIGKMVSHHGVRGEIKIYPYTDDVTKFLDFDSLYIVKAEDFTKKDSTNAEKDFPNRADFAKNADFSKKKRDSEGAADSGGFSASYRSMEIEHCRIHKNMVLVKWRGIETIEAGLHLIGSEVAADRALLDDGEGGHFIVDLIGLRVTDEYGADLGRVTDVIQNTAQDLYEIRHPSGKLYLVPVVDEFVREINVEEGYIKLSLIEGLLEI